MSKDELYISGMTQFIVDRWWQANGGWSSDSGEWIKDTVKFTVNYLLIITNAALKDQTQTTQFNVRGINNNKPTANFW